MNRLFEFRCVNGHKFEKYTDSKDRTARCECGAEAKRIISAPPFHLDGTDPGFPGAYSRWAKMHTKEAQVTK